MSKLSYFPPEGLRQPASPSLSDLYEAMESGAILEATAQRCGIDHTLFFNLNGTVGQMSREEAIAPWISGADRDISVLSRVGKQTCFTVIEMQKCTSGHAVASLSRRIAQETAMNHFEEHLKPGMILSCRIVRLESFGVFLDIGCGIIAMLPIDRISISRIQHPKDRFRVGQTIYAAVLSMDKAQRRITMTHRELLGTWAENIAQFSAGETVSGIVRSIMDYGAFIELTPNLSGLADVNGMSLSPGDRVSVFIKSIRPERMKIKLQLIEQLSTSDTSVPSQYYITSGKLERWIYSPPGCLKTPIETDFTAFPL